MKRIFTYFSEGELFNVRQVSLIAVFYVWAMTMLALGITKQNAW